MKKYIFIMLLLLSNIISFGEWETGFINNRKDYFNKIEGVWKFEEDASNVFEIKKIGKDWYFIYYYFDSGTYKKDKIGHLKNGTFLRRENEGDEYYIGYDTEVDEIMIVTADLSRGIGSGRLDDAVEMIYSKEGYTNVRTGPSKNSRVKIQIPNGTKILKSEYSDESRSDWVEVMYFNYDKGIVGKGFVHKSQIRKNSN